MTEEKQGVCVSRRESNLGYVIYRTEANPGEKIIQERV